VLKRNGYTTAYLGKNHTPGLRYWDFDYYYGNRLGHRGFYPKAAQPIFNNATADTQPEILGEGAVNFLETDARFVERAGEKAGVFLRQRPKDQPFFLHVCFNVPHSAGTRSMRQRPADEALDRTTYRDLESQMPLPPGYIAEADVKTPKLPLDIYSGKQIASYDYRRTPETLREQRVRVCQTVTGIDRVVGQILEQLRRLGQADNTIIVCSSSRTKQPRVRPEAHVAPGRHARPLRRASAGNPRRPAGPPEHARRRMGERNTRRLEGRAAAALPEERGQG